MIKRIATIVCLFCVSFSSFAQTIPENFNFEHITSTPILEGGRYKPLEAYAGKAMETMTGRWTYNGHNPTAYVISIAASPEWANKNLILIDYRPLKELIGLEPTQKRFSYNTLFNNGELMRLQQRVMQKVQTKQDLSTLENKVANIMHRLNIFQRIQSGEALTIVPPPPGSKPEAEWLTLSQMGVYAEEKQNEILQTWNQVLSSIREQNAAQFEEATKSLNTQLAALHPERVPTDAQMQREINFYRTRPFLYSWIFYLIAFFAFLISFQFPNKITTWTGIVTIGIGYIYNTYGFISRSLIAGHPSVSNMYESVIFVGWGIITIALVFELIYRQRWFATMASIMGVAMLIFADLMPFDSNIEPLVPVLKSNYWLIIHVMTITLSYSAFALATALAHVVLLLYFIHSNRHQLLFTLSLFLYRVLQVGIVLLAAGTIFGGVWAAESWGRFWGWDPKETWALISLLGYLAILHARYTGWLRNIGTAVSSILGFWLILMTWYGVNFVLGTGLHSYGFGAGGGWYVLGFLLFESFFLIAFAARYYLSDTLKTSADTLQPQSVDGN
ncbi:cytochrome C biogenesis protein [bacterium]|nr:cytochrome C biogenesis protein [bacterium]